MEKKSILDVKEVAVYEAKTLESCVQHAAASRNKIKRVIQKNMVNRGIKRLPVSDLQFGITILDSDNPYDIIDNMISEFNNCMMTAWSDHIELLSLKNKLLIAQEAEITIINETSTEDSRTEESIRRRA